MRRRRRKRAIPGDTRIAIAARYGCHPGSSAPAMCAKCEAPGAVHRMYRDKWVTFSNLEMDHIVPEYLGGSSKPENIQLLCRRCNRSKGWRGWLSNGI